MTTALCGICQAPCQDPTAYLCRDHQRGLARAIATIADLAGDATAVIARQVRTGPATAGSSAGAPPPLPVDLAAARTAWAVGNTLTTWARHVSETRGMLIPAPERVVGPLCPGGWWCKHHTCQTIAWRGLQPVGRTVALWLAGHVRWLAYRPEAAEAYADLDDAALSLKRVVFGPRAKAYYGRCWEPDPKLPTGQCEGELYADPKAALVTCPDCGLEYDTETRRTWLLGRLRERRAGAADAARALAAFGVQVDGRAVTSAMIRNWADRGRLAADGNHAYLIAEVIAVAGQIDAAKTRHTQSERISA